MIVVESGKTTGARAMTGSGQRLTWPAIGAVATAVLGSVVLGGLTSFGQTFLPVAIQPFANSASGWTMLAFLMVWIVRARRRLGSVLGAVVFVGLVEGYAVVSNLRGFYYSYVDAWVFVGLIGGPLLGFSAALTRHGFRASDLRGRVLGIAPMCAVLSGEGAYGLRYLSDTTGTSYWIIVIVLAALFLVAANVRRRPGLPATLASVGVTLLGTSLFYGACVTLLQ